MRRISACISAIAITLSIGLHALAEKNTLPVRAKEILHKAEEFELLSLDPDWSKPKAKDDFHGHRVLGKTVVKDQDVRKKILAGP